MDSKLANACRQHWSVAELAEKLRGLEVNIRESKNKVVEREHIAPAYYSIEEEFVWAHELMVGKSKVESAVILVYWNCTFNKQLKYELLLATNLNDFPKMPRAYISGEKK